jgi:hypothetical protein
MSCRGRHVKIMTSQKKLCGQGKIHGSIALNNNKTRRCKEPHIQLNAEHRQESHKYYAQLANKVGTDGDRGGNAPTKYLIRSRGVHRYPPVGVLKASREEEVE